MNHKIPIKVALVGVGNCASALVQGVKYYSNNPGAPGLIVREVQGLTPDNIEFVAAFDVDDSKVNKPLGKAIFRGNNNVPESGVSTESVSCNVYPSPVFDSIGTSYKESITIASGDDALVDDVLCDKDPDVLVNYLPVGSDKATEYWAEKCINHGISFLNAIPSFIASDDEWAKRFEKADLPCAGDDVKSQIGATIIHRALVSLFSSRGVNLTNSYQLNVGGNMDFLNMKDDERLSSKRTSKRSSVRNETDSENANLHITPSDYIDFLGDEKIAYINLAGNIFAGSDVEIECKIKVFDSNNSAGVVVDVIRFLAVARMSDESGPIQVCPFYFKSPPNNLADDRAEEIVRAIAEK